VLAFDLLHRQLSSRVLRGRKMPLIDTCLVCVIPADAKRHQQGAEFQEHCILPGTHNIREHSPCVMVNRRLCRKFAFFGVFPLFSSPVVIRGDSMIDFKGSHFEKEIIIWGVRWYVAYPISYRQLEEMMQERGVAVDHSTLNRWVIKYAPEVEKQFRRRQRPVGKSWRMDETYVRIKGQSKYLYRAVL
jgi:hypothetical protein